jgi:PASTA domain
MLIQARSARIATAGLIVFAALVLSATAAAVVPDNDAFADAAGVSGRTAFLSGSNVDATKETGEPDHAGEPGGRSIWYRWTAPAAGRATVSTCASEADTVLAVYTGTAVDDLEQVAAADDDCGEQSRVSFEASAGTEYRIAVDGVGGDSGPIGLDLNLAPSNDDFAAAVALSGDNGGTSGTSEGSTTEAEEPEHYFGAGYPSVWFTWAAPSSGWATFETCGSGFDTVLAAYVGASLADLAEVASNDDAECSPGSRISFEASGGTVYSIAVAGYGGTTGEFTLSWTRNPPPPEPPYALASPRISGGAVEGQTLTASEGEWGGAQPISFTYAWGRCDRDYERCGLIDGANAKTYAPTASDVGWRMYVRVTAMNVVASTAAFSNLTAPVAARPPLNMVVPFVTGRAGPGGILVATSGEWSGTGPMSMTYQWQSCSLAEDCVDLPGEAGPVIRVTAAHVARSLRVVVTATNPGGSATAESDATALVRKKPARACVVPNVKRKTAAAARRAIRRAGCTVGRIRRSHSSIRSGRVVSQSPRAGARRGAGAKVALVLSKGKRR